MSKRPIATTSFNQRNESKRQKTFGKINDF